MSSISGNETHFQIPEWILGEFQKRHHHEVQEILTAIGQIDWSYQTKAYTFLSLAELSLFLSQFVLFWKFVFATHVTLG